MRGAVLYGPGDVRFEERAYRGLQAINGATPMGHEYCGIVEEVGGAVKSVKPGQFVIGSFFASDNTCPHCHAGYQTSCNHKAFVCGPQAPLLRVPLADGTLVATPEVPPDELVPNLVALSDVMGTGWFASDAANVKLGATVAVVGDGAVDLLGILSAKEMGAERIIAMSRHEARQKLAREFGATDIVTERGDAGVARIKELTGSVPTRCSSASARGSRLCRRFAPPGREGTLATSASRTGSSSTAKSCSIVTSTSMVAQPRSDDIFQR
jgi:threonine dehydrogenase-like Zn-dependent dehydrogenase